MDGFEVHDDPDAGRFELRRDGELVSYAVYENRDGVVVVPHVETIARHRGNGYGARLMEGLLSIIRADQRRITPLCSFAASHIDEHPEHHDLLN